MQHVVPWFMHIPKTAGTSIGTMMSSHFRTCHGINRPGMHRQFNFAVDDQCHDKISSWIQNDKGASFSQITKTHGLDSCEFLWASHYSLPILQAAHRVYTRSPIVLFTFVRNPIDQFYSWWWFMRYCANYPRHIIGYDPSRSLMNETLPTLLMHDNIHCNPIITRECRSTRFRSIFYFAGHSMTCGDEPVESMNVKQVYEKAIENRKKFDFIGIHEDMMGSIQRLQQYFSIPLHKTAPTVNKCRPKLKDEDKRTNAFDKKLEDFLQYDVMFYNTLSHTSSLHEDL